MVEKKYSSQLSTGLTAFNFNSVEYSSFLSNLNELYAKIKLEKPYMTFFTGDFNAHSQLWYPDGISTPEEEGKGKFYFISRFASNY